MAKVRIVRGNVGTTFIVALEDNDGAVDVSQSDTSIFLKIKSVSSSELIDTITGEKLGGRRMEDGSVDPSYTVLGEKGRVQFTWSDAVFAAPAGDYVGEIEVHWNGGAIIRTVYDLYQFTLRDPL